MWYKDFSGPALRLDGSDEHCAHLNGTNYKVHADIIIDQIGTWT